MKDNSIKMNERESIARALMPIIFVLDTSGGMAGCPISMLNHAMEVAVNRLKELETLCPDFLLKIGILQVNTGAHWVQSKGLEEIENFVYSPLTAGGLNDMGAALSELDSKLSRNAFLVSTTGWFRPVIIFFTYRQPTDNWELPLKNLRNNNKWYQHSTKIGIVVGDEVDLKMLSEIVCDSEAVIHLEDFALIKVLLKKVAVNAIHIQPSFLASENYAKRIVRRVLSDFGQNDKVKAASDMGVKVSVVAPPTHKEKFVTPTHEEKSVTEIEFEAEPDCVAEWNDDDWQ